MKTGFDNISQKINQRDKQLLMILLAVVIAFVIYYFIISPGLDSYTEKSAQVNSLESELVIVNESIQNISKLRNEDRTQRQNLTLKYKLFFGALKEDRLLNQLDILMRAAAFKVSGISISEKTVTTIDLAKGAYTPNQYPLSDLANKVNPPINNTIINPSADKSGEQAANQQQTDSGKPAAPEDSVEMLQVNLSYADTGYTSIVAFLKSLEGMGKSIIVSNATFTKSDTGTGLSGAMTLNIYSIPKVGTTEDDYLQFNQQYTNGAGGLF